MKQINNSSVLTPRLSVQYFQNDSRRLFLDIPEKPVKLQSAYFDMMAFKHVFNVRKTKNTAKI